MKQGRIIMLATSRCLQGSHHIAFAIVAWIVFSVTSCCARGPKRNSRETAETPPQGKEAETEKSEENEPWTVKVGENVSRNAEENIGNRTIRKIEGKFSNEVFEDIMNTYYLSGEERKRALRKLKYADSEEVLETIAFAIENKRGTNEALRYAYFHCNDKRLYPAVESVLKNGKHVEVFWAINISGELGVTKAIGHLIKIGKANTTFILRRHTSPDGGKHKRYESQFLEVAEALFKLTHGEIGIEEVNRRKLFKKSEVQKLIKNWEEWYEYNKNRID
jgi:hypothetical protein